MRGGKREGAGRPKGTTKERRVKFTITLPKDLKEWVDKQTLSQSKVVERALIEYRKLVMINNKTKPE